MFNVAINFLSAPFRHRPSDRHAHLPTLFREDPKLMDMTFVVERQLSGDPKQREQGRQQKNDDWKDYFSVM